MTPIARCLPPAAVDAIRASDDPKFRDWWDILDSYLRDAGELDATLAEAWRFYNDGWNPDAAGHEIADRRATRPGNAVGGPR